MKRNLLLTLLFLGSALSMHAAVTYSIIALGPLNGGRLSQPGALSANGTVGFSADWIPTFSFSNGNGIPGNALIYSGGTYSQAFLSTPCCGSSNPATYVTGVNDSGAITGYFSSGGFPAPTTAFVFGGGTGNPGDPQGGFGSNIVPTGLDNAGNVAGTVLGSTIPVPNTPDRAYLWNTDGSYVDFNALGAFTASEALAISPNGYVAGYGTTDSSTTGAIGSTLFLYHNGSLTKFAASSNLNGLYSPLVGNAYLALSSTGVIAVTDPSTGHILLVPPNGQITDLGVGYSPSGINASGTIVAGNFVYSGGVFSDLNSLIPQNSGYQNLNAVAINDSGTILASAYDSTGAQTSLLLTPLQSPVPEPASALLFLTATGLLSLYKLRKSPDKTR